MEIMTFFMKMKNIFVGRQRRLTEAKEEEEVI